MNLSTCELIMSTIAQFFSVEDKVEIKIRAIVWICSIAINKFVIICNEMTTLVSLESTALCFFEMKIVKEDLTLVFLNV